jgi:hypothetical protein
MKVIIEEVSSGAEGVWTANIDPQRLIRLAKPIRQGGRINVVLVARPAYDADTHSLQFDLDSAILLNLGNTFEAVLIDSREKEAIQPAPVSPPHTQNHPSGDRRFLEELSRLPDSLKKVGDELLTEVRKEYPGELVFHQKSGKFVESPDNFWVVRIQPRAQSLRIIVYGTPKEHGPQNSIELKDDMAGYSNFVVNSQHQVLEAVNVIRKAKQLKDRR